jgi:hypothetical protein
LKQPDLEQLGFDPIYEEDSEEEFSVPEKSIELDMLSHTLEDETIKIDIRLSPVRPLLPKI